EPVDCGHDREAHQPLKSTDSTGGLVDACVNPGGDAITEDSDGGELESCGPDATEAHAKRTRREKCESDQQCRFESGHEPKTERHSRDTGSAQRIFPCIKRGVDSEADDQ